ncbi:MAG: YkgJ family cysteine cluster protein [Thermoplasmata archaeon]|nr:YkgJ family cysteine cluster protein [Thermoplasmata archaeon]
MALSRLDGALLGGFRFQCRPGCGLCCFAEPAVTSEERQRLVQIEPDLEFVEGERGWAFLAARPNGGACELLSENRCRAHGGRPTPCQQFPVTVHVSDRAQASLVLSCPGLDPSGLLRWSAGPPTAQAPVGLAAELAAAEAEWVRSGTERELDRHAVKRGRSLSAAGVTGLRAALHRELPWPEPTDFPSEDPPDAEDGFEELPITFVGAHGRVAFGSHPGGWMLLAISEAGDEPKTLGVVPPPTSPPPLTTAGEQLVRAYLHYLVERDDAIDGVFAQGGPEGPVTDAVAADLVRTAATVLSRASVLQRLDGREEPLDAADIWDGIRATDAEWLDRPTTGRRF